MRQCEIVDILLTNKKPLTAKEIAVLLGTSTKHAQILLRKARKCGLVKADFRQREALYSTNITKVKTWI